MNMRVRDEHEGEGERLKISPGRAVVPGVTPSAHAMIDTVTSCGALPSVVLVTLMMISLTLPVGKSSLSSDVGAPVTLTGLSPDSGLNVTSISAILLDGTLTSRTIAPPLGISITMLGFLSVKSTPFLIRSSLFGISDGVVRTAFVATRVLMYSISSQPFRVVPLVPVVPGVPFVAVVPGVPVVPLVSLVPLVPVVP